MKIISSIALWMCASAMLFAQDDHYTVVAKQGDGIFSLLRKQGLDPAKHYEEFIKLNSENIKNGSFLKVGATYKVPKAEDSFKKTGTQILVSTKEEKPIFDAELANMSLKSKTLKDAVYYLIVDNGNKLQNNFVNDIVEGLAAELMVNGAKVFILGFEQSDVPKVAEKSAKIQTMGNYIEAINKRFLQNTGKYQRVLVLRANDVTDKGNMDVAVYHYVKSEKGQRFAENIQNAFKKHSVSNRSSEDVHLIFKDKSSLFLAKNVIPPVSLITMESASKKQEEAKIPMRSDKKLLTGLLTNGIMNDYADLSFEE